MKNFFRKIIRICWKILLAFFVLSIFSVLVFRFVPVPFTPLMLIRCVQQKISGKELKLDKSWESLDAISPNLQLAVVCSEDQTFLTNHGFDFQAMENAYDHNEKNRHIRGGSTISQETAKNVFLWTGRNYFRKGVEAYFTVLIEFIWGKKRIMQTYLNVIEMGDGIYGAEAASEKYFHKHAKYLTKSEAALIAAVLPNPRKWNPAHPDAFIIDRQQWILAQMNNLGGELKY
ncbi:MAG: monofunctional biosynthetic peptidoglycan transglycosylase [Bacteroidia bacterium]